jgi:hypothetical protein
MPFLITTTGARTSRRVDQPERHRPAQRQRELLVVAGEHQLGCSPCRAHRREHRHRLREVVDVHEVDPVQLVAPGVRRGHHVDPALGQPGDEGHLRRWVDASPVLLVPAEHSADDHDFHATTSGARVLAQREAITNATTGQEK